MKLVRFDKGRTGLLVELPSGPHVIDIAESLGALAPGDPISQGLLNGMLKENGSWAPLIEHWALARIGLRRLLSLALSNPDEERLVIRRAADIRMGAPVEGSFGIAALHITEIATAHDPTGREAMARQFDVPSPASGRAGQPVVMLGSFRR